MNRLTALNVFRHAVEFGSFAEASRQLRLSPAAVSKNISELEAHLGARLFNRTTRRMSVTEAGNLYYERIVRVLGELEEADGALSEMQEAPKGLLRVSAPVTLTLVSLSSAIPKFLDRYPDLTLDLKMDDRRVNLIEGGFDLAIRGTAHLEDSSLIARKLLTMVHILCAAPSYFERFGVPANPEDLVKHRCVQFSLSDHASKWDFRKGGRTVSIPINGPYKVSSSLAVRDALLAGFGLSLVPWMYVKKDLEEGRLQSALNDWSFNETQLFAVYPSRQYLASKVRAFLDFLVEEFAKGEYRKGTNTP